MSARFCLPRTLLTYDLTPRALALYVVLAARADATGTTPEIPVGELARAIQLRDATGFARVVGELARAHLVEVVRRGRGHPHAYRLNTDPDPMPAFKTVAPRAADDPAGRPDQTNLTGDDPAGRPDHRVDSTHRSSQTQLTVDDSTGRSSQTAAARARARVERVTPGSGEKTGDEPGLNVSGPGLSDTGQPSPNPPTPLPSPTAGRAVPKPNKLGAVLDAIQAAGVAYGGNAGRDGAAVKRCAAPAADIAAAYVAAATGRWGDDWLQDNLAIWAVVDRLGGYYRWRDAAGRETEGRAESGRRVGAGAVRRGEPDGGHGAGARGVGAGRRAPPTFAEYDELVLNP